MKRSLVLAILLIVIAAILVTSLAVGATATGPNVTVVGNSPYTIYPDRVAQTAMDPMRSEFGMGLPPNIEFRWVSELSACPTEKSGYCLVLSSDKVAIYLEANPQLDLRYAQPLTEYLARSLCEASLLYDGQDKSLTPAWFAQKKSYCAGTIVHKWIFLGEYHRVDGSLWH